ncbi:hypothetical protein IE53DRAFT_283674 [Violaceomyces palustris]|uniref:Uncharacterized protein n=1 Tax=Violaceomyces palustris TaxID=1673888 RepID=A0ACD0NM75_9BASI|nr:hypothetical protein IE53DRAFT_283674 [Violaceomyces palustris]
MSASNPPPPPLGSTTRPQSRRSSLPLGLKRYHLVYLSYLSSILLLGITYSILTGSHIPNQIRHGRIPPPPPTTLPQDGVEPLLSTPLPSFTNLPLPEPTYWQDKRNFLNRQFVKKCWLWTTLAFALHLYAFRSYSKPTNLKGKRKEGEEGGEERRPSWWNPTKRYLISTLLWLVLISTPLHLFGGASSSSSSDPIKTTLTERILMLTGAECVSPSLSSLSSLDPQSCLKVSTSTQSIQSTGGGGGVRPNWRGGHDLSGHTFLLTLSTLCILEDLTPFLPKLLGGGGLDRTQQRDWKRSLSLTFSLTLISIWSWMLLMTSLYFHSPAEKVSAFLLALASWTILPKGG